MSLRVRADPIDRDITLMLSESLSQKAQSATLAEFAREQIEEAKQTNKSVLGRVPRHTITVDGREGASLESVKPNGYVIAEFELFNEALQWIGDQLEKHSPVGPTGRYKKSHNLFADGVLVPVGNTVPPADEYIFMNAVPYARKIEGGPGKVATSSQAPEGVYQAVSVLAQGRFGNSAKIIFTFRGYLGGEIGDWASKTSSGGHIRNEARRAEWLIRQPAVIVRPLRS